MSNPEVKKEHAKLRRKATDIAGQIHDIVEDTLWTEYKNLPELSSQLIEACDKAINFKKEHQL